MVQTERAQFESAWRALADPTGTHGWKTILIVNEDAFQVRAGRHLTGNEEALLFGFAAVQPPLQTDLPSGTGFDVAVVKPDGEATTRMWLALLRQKGADHDLFVEMALDLVGVLRRGSGDGPALMRMLLRRIEAWQDFMRQRPDGKLSTAEEIGLFGELEVLVGLLDEGVPPLAAVSAWQGPLNGLHDFRFESGAIEVKTTLAAIGFRAHIASLDQLDPATAAPLFMAGVRISASADGRKLTEQVERVREALANNTQASEEFDRRLLYTGFLDVESESFTRCFITRSVRIVPIGENFPSLIRTVVPAAITWARYELDLDQVQSVDVKLSDALILLGVVR